MIIWLVYRKEPTWARAVDAAMLLIENDYELTELNDRAVELAERISRNFEELLE